MGEVKQMKNAGSQNLNLQQKFEVKVLFTDDSGLLTFIARNVNFQDGMMIIINEDMSISGFNNNIINHFTIKNITDQEEEK